MLRATNRLLIRVPQVPSFPRVDQPANLHAADELRPTAGRTPGTPHRTRRHHGPPTFPPPTVRLVRILAPIRLLTGQVPMPHRTKLLLPLARLELRTAQETQPCAETDLTRLPRDRGVTTTTAQLLIPMRRPEKTLASLARDQSRVAGRDRRELGGVFFIWRVKAGTHGKTDFPPTLRTCPIPGRRSSWP